jgi:hypothetical protein
MKCQMFESSDKTEIASYFKKNILFPKKSILPRNYGAPGSKDAHQMKDQR